MCVDPLTVEELAAALKRYGRHDALCPARPVPWSPKDRHGASKGKTYDVGAPQHTCTCGLYALLLRAGLEKPPPAQAPEAQRCTSTYRGARCALIGGPFHGARHCDDARAVAPTEWTDAQADKPTAA